MIRKAPGPDNLMAEHLIEDDQSVVICLTNILIWKLYISWLLVGLSLSTRAQENALQKAFDSIEYPILLRRLYDLGVNGESSRISTKMCHIKWSWMMEFSLRGVKQGSVLSPALFLLVMDHLLTKLQSSGMGLSINKFYAGSFLCTCRQ